MSQFEQENDLGRGGGEVDAETMDDAWQAAEERRSTANIDTGAEGEEEPPDDVDDADLEGDGGLPDDPDPWAKTSSGDTD